MSPAEFAVTLDELQAALNLFLAKECQESGDHLIHRGCGGGIRIGFLNLFYLNDGGSLDPGQDGFGIGPQKVPYCERCFSPDGFNHTYAVRFPILRKRVSEGQRCRILTWGSGKSVAGSLKLHLEQSFEGLKVLL